MIRHASRRARPRDVICNTNVDGDDRRKKKLIIIIVYKVVGGAGRNDVVHTSLIRDPHGITPHTSASIRLPHAVIE